MPDQLIAAGQKMETNPIETSSVEAPQVLSNAPSAPEEKPRRGRPPGSKNRVREEIPQTSASVTPIQIEAPKRGPGRPAGSGKSSPRKGVDTKALAKQLEFFHAIAARVTKFDDLQIDSEEAEMLADSIATLMREYDVTMSGKTAALLGMLGSAAIVYGPRYMMIREQIQKRQPKQGD